MKSAVVALAVFSVCGVAVADDPVWVELLRRTTNMEFLSLAVDSVDPQVVYAIFGGEGLFRSDDSGMTWSQPAGTRVSAPFDQVFVERVFPDPLQARRVYGINQEGLFRSNNAGATWEHLWRDGPYYLDGHHPWSLAHALVFDLTDSSSLYVTRGFVCSNVTCVGGNILRSADAGNTWRELGFHGRGAGHLSIGYSTPPVLYAAGGLPRLSPGMIETGLYRSDDGGATWQMTVQGDTTIKALAVAPFDAQTVYAAAASQHWTPIFKSTDGGWIWTYLPTRIREEYFRVNTLVVDPLAPQTVYAGTTIGVLRSLDGGNTWAEFNTGLPEGCSVSKLVATRSSGRLWAGAV